MRTIEKSRATMQTTSGIGVDIETEHPCKTAVTEVWPGEFELRIETGNGDVPTTTVHTLDAPQLRLLRARIENALDDAQ